jgi:adenine-specific DNA-methyltransferase
MVLQLLPIRFLSPINYTIPTIKASTGKWYKAFFPYDNNGNPIPKEKIFTHTAVSSYLLSHKDELLKGNNANNPMWYLYGRTQALKDVNSHKIAINTTIKGTDSIKLNNVPAGCGVYSGLYILSDIPYDIISDIIISDDFIKYIASLKKYKSGGYYTFSSKDLETYLNYKISQLISNEKLSLKPTNKQGFLDRHLSLF